MFFIGLLEDPLEVEGDCGSGDGMGGKDAVREGVTGGISSTGLDEVEGASCKTKDNYMTVPYIYEPTHSIGILKTEN